MPSLTALPLLDVAIGLVLLFFLLSTLCSVANEMLASLLGWRAKTLEDAVRNMLEDPPVKAKLGKIADDAGDFTAEVFSHWRIKGLVRDPGSTWRRRSRPSYLPPRALSLAIAEKLVEGAKTDPVQSPWKLADDDLLVRVKKAVDELPPGVNALVYKAAENAHGTLEGFRTQVEAAFDDAMERASGWYKRKVQAVLLVMALAITLGGNVDTVRISERLWNDDAVRAAAVSQAQEVVAAPTSSGETPTKSQAAATQVEQVKELHFPIGWGDETAPHDLGGILGRIPGWLITIAALSLGAPFWFDLLSRLARLRSSGVTEQPRTLSDSTKTASSDRVAPSSKVAERLGEAGS